MGCVQRNDILIPIFPTLTAALPLFLRTPTSHLLCLDHPRRCYSLTSEMSLLWPFKKHCQFISVHSLSHLSVVHTQETFAVPSYPKRALLRSSILGTRKNGHVSTLCCFAILPRLSPGTLSHSCSSKTPHCMRLPSSGVLLHYCPALNGVETYGSEPQIYLSSTHFQPQ
jgi:hypothetical protein